MAGIQFKLRGSNFNNANLPNINDLVLTPLTWSNGGSQIGDVITVAAPNNGSLASPAINSQADFRADVLITSGSSDSLCIYLDTSAALNFTWAGISFLRGIYAFQGSIYSTVANTGAVNLGAFTYPSTFRFEKSGNNLLLKKSTDGVTFSTLATYAGVLASTGIIYLKSVLSLGSNRSANVKLYV